MASKVEIASNAFLLLGGNTISSFTEGTEGKIATALYEETYRDLLSNYRWRFATKKMRLSRLTEAPENEFDYQFQLPTDMLTLIKPLDRIDYEIYGDKLYANVTDVSIDFVYRVDEAMLPSYFTKTLEFFLASQFAIPLTDNTSRAEFYFNAYTAQLRVARNTDANQRPGDSVYSRLVRL
jgi:hypothetical protein